MSEIELGKGDYPVKRIVCMVLVLLCVGVVAMAETVPSKNTADMVTVEIDRNLNPNIPTDAGFTVLPILEEDPEQAERYAEDITLCQDEIAKLAQNVNQGADIGASAAVENYFGQVSDAEGNPVRLSEALSAQTLNVHEFMPLTVSHYDSNYGPVVCTFRFKTPYGLDEQVLVLVGIQNGQDQTLGWTAFEGVGTGEEGAIQVEFTPQIMQDVQDRVALLAVVSAGDAPQV